MKTFLYIVLILLAMTARVDFVEAASIGLTWEAPTTNADGTAISNFVPAVYRIYYGTATGAYNPTPVVITNNSAVVTATLSGLADDTLYFSMVTAVNTYGNESAPSNEVSKRTAKPTPSAPKNYR